MRGPAARAWSVVFALAGAGGGLALVAAPPQGAVGQPVTLTAPSAAPAALIRSGDLAAASGNYALADTQYRRAWQEPGSRPEATVALRQLHRVPGFRLPVETRSVEQTARLLGASFRRFDTAHFAVLSDCPADWSRQRAAVLERTREQYFRAMDKLGLEPVPHARKLLCVLIDDHAAYRRFGQALDGLDADWVAGYYSTAGNRVVFYNDSTSPGMAAARARLAEYDEQAGEARARADEARRANQDAAAQRLLASAEELSARVREERARLEREASGYSLAKTIHECVHLLSFNTGVQRRDREYPLWLSEGLATNFETDDPERAFGPDRALPTSPGSRRARLLVLAAGGKAPRVADLLTVGAAPKWDADTADAMYALSDALFAYLYRREPKALGRYIRALGEEPPGEVGPRRGLELFAAHFGEPESVERRMMLELR